MATLLRSGGRTRDLEAPHEAAPARMRRLRHRMEAVATTLAVAVALVTLAAGPAGAHHKTHNVYISGNMYIVDSEPWPFPAERRRVYFNGVVNVGPSQPAATFVAEGCAGDEVRVFLYVQIQDGPNDRSVTTTVLTRLYEGTSCSTSDFDGSRLAGTFTVPADTTIPVPTFRVRNTAEGGDWADLTVKIHNDV